MTDYTFRYTPHNTTIPLQQVGAPMFADQRFMDAAAARINQRNIVYVISNTCPLYVEKEKRRRLLDGYC